MHTVNTTTANPSRPQMETCCITPGTRADYDALAHLHYRGGPPATIARSRDGMPAILTARDEDGRLAGVLVVSMPTLNGSWRSLAWPGAYTSGDKRRDALEINRTLRCISRVIVDPRFRGQGVARTLVRTYLDEPLTPRTEAIAAMGHVCPFFAAAGMTAYPLPPSARDARLLDALASVGLEPWELLESRGAARTLDSHPWLSREARTWAGGSPSTRRHKDAEPLSLLMLAASHAGQRPIAYAHGG
ncbi:MAG: GNAT family N-acetyltransferase [Planctomycetota bacterium]|nr:GNAT family N-acetyltransferase [Planctomycetota bacterium]